MNIIELLVLAAIWGASFLFMRIAVPYFGPVPLIALRVGIATVVLLPVLRNRSLRAQLLAHWRPLLVVAVTNSALPFTLFAFSTLYVNAGFDSILNATAPIWAAVIAYAWLRAPLTSLQTVGLALGLCGVVILAWDTVGSGEGPASLAIAASLLATLCYGFAANYSKRHLAGLSPIGAAFGSQLWSVVVLAPLALLYWPAQAVPAHIWYAVIALGVLCTGVAYVLYFRLISHAGSAFAVSVTFLIPIFGMLWGALFLDEPVTATMIAGCGVVLIGTALASGTLAGMIRSARS